MEVRAETLNVILQQIIPLSESPLPHSDDTVASTLRTLGSRRHGGAHLGRFHADIEMTAAPEFIWGQLKATANIHGKLTESFVRFMATVELE